MSNEVKFVYFTGKTLKFTAYQPGGTLRGVANQDLPEVATEYYTATPSTALVAGDTVKVRDTVLNNVVGSGEYKPEMVSAEITLDLTDLEAKVNGILGTQILVNETIDKAKKAEELVVIRNL